MWPAGLASDPRQKILYAQVANLDETIVYRWNDDARLTFVRAIPNPGSFLPCWTHVNAAGTRMYSGNAGSDSLTVFDISRNPTDPRPIQTVRAQRPGNPWNFQIDPTGHVIFLLDMRATRQIPAGKGNQLHALRIGPGGLLTEERSSPVKIPVPVGTNPVGLAIVPARAASESTRGPRAVAPSWDGPSLVGSLDLLVVRSDALAENPLDDPAVRPLYVYERAVLGWRSR